jgi:hypothetical protein
MHKARSSQLLPLPTDIEETHKALGAAIQVLTISKEQILLVNDLKKKYCKVFLQYRLKVS